MKLHILEEWLVMDSVHLMNEGWISDLKHILYAMSHLGFFHSAKLCLRRTLGTQNGISLFNAMPHSTVQYRSVDNSFINVKVLNA